MDIILRDKKKDFDIDTKGSCAVTQTDGHALRFNGNNYALTKDAVDLTGSFTIMGWMKKPVLANNETTLLVGTIRSFAQGDSFIFGVVHLNGIYAVIGGYLVADVVSNIDYTLPNTWQHIAFTHDALTGNSILYQNGIIVATDTLPPCLINQPIRMGNSASIGLSQKGFDADEIIISRRVMSPQEISIAYLDDIGKYFVADENCVLKCHFDEGSGTTILDKSGYGRNGTITGATYVPGKQGTALKFNGHDSAEIDLDGNYCGEFSISLWHNVNQGERPPTTVFSWADALFSVNPFVRLQRNSGISVRWFIDGAYQMTIQNPYFLTNSWEHLALTYKDGTWKAYYRGTLASQYVGTKINVNNVLKIFLGDGNSFSPIGKIDEFYVYNRRLTDNEVAMLYSLNFGKYLETPDKLTVGYHLDDDFGTDLSYNMSDLGTNQNSLELIPDGSGNYPIRILGKVKRTNAVIKKGYITIKSKI